MLGTFLSYFPSDYLRQSLKDKTLNLEFTNVNCGWPQSPKGRLIPASPGLM